MQKKERGGNSSISNVYDFGSITWKGAELGKLKEHLIENIDLIERYPEREAESIIRLLSRRLEVQEDQVIVTDGATGALHLVASVAKGATSLILPPTNQEFRHALDRAEHTIKEQRGVKDLSKLDLTGIDYLWLCNPNTPDGRLFSRRSILNLLREHPNVNVVVDLSMASFVVEDNIKASDLKKYPNLITVGSFSSAYNIPGMRVGYAVADSQRMEAFKQNYTPRCVSSLALETTRFILLHPAQFTIPIRKWLRDSMELAEKLDSLYGIEVIYGSTPYFIIKVSRGGTASDLSHYLWENYNILIGTKETDLDLAEDEARICGYIGDRNNQILVDAIAEYTMSYTEDGSEEVEK